MSLSFEHKRCLVTGSTDQQSIGNVCAEGLIQGNAAHVTLMGRDADKVASAVQGLQAHGKNVYSGSTSIALSLSLSVHSSAPACIHHFLDSCIKDTNIRRCG